MNSFFGRHTTQSTCSASSVATKEIGHGPCRAYISAIVKLLLLNKRPVFRVCFTGIWKSSIRLDTKVHLYQTYIVPVLLYGCETWSTTKFQCARIDAFDMWALCKILRMPYTRHVTNVEVRATTGCRPLSILVTDRCLRLFGHIACSSPQEDHHRAVAAVIRRLPLEWKRPLGRPSHTWLRAVEADLGQQNIGLASAWTKAAIRDDWRRIVDTATLQRSTL